MPLGNYTSQFLANIYLDNFDHFVKEKLKAKYYIRYVDDFVILHKSKEQLELWKNSINIFLKRKLKLELHSDKSKIIRLKNGVNFLGFKIFKNHKILKNSSFRLTKKNFYKLNNLVKEDNISEKKFYEKFNGWISHANHGNTYKLRKNFYNFLKNSQKPSYH